MLSLCGAPLQGLCKAPHDSGVYWKQFMMLLEEDLVCGGVSFHPPFTSRVGEGIRVRVTGRRCHGWQHSILLSPQLLFGSTLRLVGGFISAEMGSHNILFNVTLLSSIMNCFQHTPESCGALHNPCGGAPHKESISPQTRPN